MGILRVPLRFEGSVGEKVLYALFDGGATFSCLRHDVAREIEEPSKLRRPLEVATASEGHYVKISEALRADFYYDDIRLSDEFMVVQGLSEEAIIGVNTLQKWRIKLDFEHDTIIVDPKVAKLILKQLK
jgi:predicted aspartyl protease